MFGLMSCNSEMTWTPETEASFKKQCTSSIAKQFKADNPDEFCQCFLDKLKEENLGMMDLIKETKRVGQECGGTL